MTAKIDKKKCSACGECFSSCPLDCITLSEDDHKAVIDVETCGECGACIDVCPLEAISLE